MFIYLIMCHMIVFNLIIFSLFMYLFIEKLSFFISLNLMNLLTIKIELILLIDWVSLLFIFVVLFISLMVIMYSIEYMEGDLKVKRFLILVLLFILSMMLMILSPNLLSILLGWDGLGLSSYCLVIYYQGKSSFNSGMVTVLFNRLGDILILVSVGLMMNSGTLNMMYIYKNDILIFWMLMIGSFTKSAQIPFSTWLPMAMAAPTPVSALVHSSTLVTAGVYLMIRLNYVMSDDLLNYMMLISISTMFMAGLSANYEFDLKKIIALSTLSQLGVMFFCLSMHLEVISLFHLLTHAMFKSLLFMCAGVIIHNMGGSQDIRQISMVSYNMPFVSMMFCCSTLSLSGLPFLSGFFSKDLILEMFLMSKFNKFIMIMLFMSMSFSLMYSIRLFYFSFIKVFENKKFFLLIMSSNKLMGISMYMLFMNSVMMGSMLNWMIFSMKNKIFLTFQMKLIIYLFLLLGLGLSLSLKKMFLGVKNYMNLNIMFKYYTYMWFMPMLYMTWTEMAFKFMKNLSKNMEMGWMEIFLYTSLKTTIYNLLKVDYIKKNYFYSLIFIMLILMFMMF